MPAGGYTITFTATLPTAPTVTVGDDVITSVASASTGFSVGTTNTILTITLTGGTFDP
jgi:hypothetical protein